MLRIDRARTAALLGFFSLLVAAIACGGGSETSEGAPAAPESASAPQTPPASPEGTRPLEIPSDAGGTGGAQISEGELPANMPEDIPIYPQAEPATSLMASGRGGLITLSSARPVADVVSFYNDALPGQGWTIEKVEETDLRTQITATKDGRTANVVAVRKGDTTEILVSFQEAG